MYLYRLIFLVLAGGLHRSRPPQVIDTISAGYRDHHSATPDDIPRVAGPVEGASMQGLASIGVILMQAPGQVCVYFAVRLSAAWEGNAP